MVTIKIDEDTLLEMLLDRVEYWTSNEDVIELYSEYYKDLIYSEYFEDTELDINYIVDNDYINYFTTISKDDFKDYDIEDETDERIVTFNEDKDLYLIRTY